MARTVLSLALVVLLATVALGAVHSRIANRVEKISDDRYSFCMHSVGVPTSSHFAAVMFFTFADEQAQPLSDDDAASHNYMIAFPNADNKLVRSSVQGASVVVHQQDAAFFNWDAEAYRVTGYTSGIVISNRPLLSVLMVVEAEHLDFLLESNECMLHKHAK
jgi:hypothetical protein